MNHHTQRSSVPTSNHSNNTRPQNRAPQSSGSAPASAQPSNTQQGSGPQRFRYEKLEVWHAAKALAIELHRALETHRNQNATFADRLQETSVLIAGDIAEGANRYGDAAMAQAVDRAAAGTARLGCELAIAQELGLMNSQQTQALTESAMGLNAKLKGFERFLNGEGPRRQGGGRRHDDDQEQ